MACHAAGKKGSEVTMDARPTNEALAAAVGEPGQKVKQLFGGPILYQFLLANGHGHQVIAIDGRIWVKSLDGLGRYLHATNMLGQKKMTMSELIALVVTYGEMPEAIHNERPSFPQGPPPSLSYGADGATLLLYGFEPPAAASPVTLPPNAPKMPMAPPVVGIAPDKWLRGTLHVPLDYKLRWEVERFDWGQQRWLPR
jgi:hypothetical protein